MNYKEEIYSKYLIKLKGKIHKKVVQGKIRKDLVDLDSIYGQLDYATLNNGIEKNIIERSGSQGKKDWCYSFEK